MNNDSQFEKRLSDQTVKTVPSEWRADILREASRAGEERSYVSAGPISWFEVIKSHINTALWPAPRAWAALLPLWIIIVVMNLSGRHESATTALNSPVAVEQARMALKQKRLLMAELAGRTETREAVQPRTTLPGPRSQRREETTVA